MKPISPEALFEDNPTNIPAGSAHCNTPVDFQSHHCIKDQGRFMIYIIKNRYLTKTYYSDALKDLSSTVEFFIRYGKRVGQWAMTACRRFPSAAVFDFYDNNPRKDPRYDPAVKAVDCIWESAIKETTTLPTEISEFYNTTIRPSIESQTELSTTRKLPYTNSNTTSGTPLGISGKALESSNSTIYTPVGGAAAGVLISGIAAIAWTYKRKSSNEKRRKIYQEMVASIEEQPVKLSVDNSLNLQILVD